MEPGHRVGSRLLCLVEADLAPAGHGEVDVTAVVRRDLGKAGGDDLVPEHHAATVSDTVDVDHRDVVVEVRTDVEILMEINFVNSELLLLLVRNLELVVPDPDVVYLEVVPVGPEAVGRGEDVEGRDEDGPTVVVGLVVRTSQPDAGLPGQSPMVNLEINTCLDVALVVNVKSSEN